MLMDIKKVAEHSLRLKKMCHAKTCAHPEECPMHHPNCRTLLDTQTAIAWMIATILDAIITHKSPFWDVYDEITEREFFLITYSMWQAMAQHIDADWFRQDISSELDFLTAATRLKREKE